MDEEKNSTGKLSQYHPLNDTEPLWTVEEVAQYLRLQPETIRMMTRQGKLPGVKVGRSWRFRAALIREYLAVNSSQRVGG